MFDVLPGFRDFYPESCSRRNFLFKHWSEWARRHDFLEYDIPTLEPLELFTRKSGPEIVGQLFHFEDQGGRSVALRPELTPSLARMIGSRINSLKRPVKWFNIAENFRYERQQKGRLRSHYQFNADIFGEAGVQADVEVIALLVGILRGLGFSADDLQVRLSDRTLWSLFLKGLGFEGDRALEVLAVIDKMERLSRKDLNERLRPFFNDAVEDFLVSLELMRSCRTLSELGDLMQRLTPTTEIRDEMARRLAEWKELLASITACGLEAYIRIDLGIVRGLAYYTGFVFEVFRLDAGGRPAGRALAGGGRFDHLVGLLGYPEVPAVGFGMGDVVIMDALEEKGLLPDLHESPEFYAVTAGAEERLLALEDATRLRAAGHRVAYGLKGSGFGKQFKLAGQSGARFALIYGSEERERNVVRIRDLSSGGEREFDRSRLPELIPGLTDGGIPKE
ncbi:MAG: histidine--tRNA ligase [Oceanipulchritudo sp.]